MMLSKALKLVESKKPIDPDVGVALISKLPTISVSWEREGSAITGYIRTDDGKEFETYAHDPLAFIRMVNDAVFTVYGIPENYRQKFFQFYYKPDKGEMELLFDGTIPSSVFKAEKTYEPLFG